MKLTEVAVGSAFDRERDRDRALAKVEVVLVSANSHAVRIHHDDALVEQTEERFRAALRSSERLAAFTRILEARRLRYCVFGGWVRDTISGLLEVQAHLPGVPRDVDLVVKDIDVDGLLGFVPPDVRSTIFGGIQSNAGSLAFDVWPLHETFLIRRLNLAPTFESLLLSTDFNINAGLFFPRQHSDAPRIMDGGMLEALATKTLDFNSSFLPFPVMQCARLAAYAGKLSLSLTPAVRTFMQHVLADSERQDQVRRGLAQTYSTNVVSLALHVLRELMGEP